MPAVTMTIRLIRKAVVQRIKQAKARGGCGGFSCIYCMNVYTVNLGKMQLQALNGHCQNRYKTFNEEFIQTGFVKP